LALPLIPAGLLPLSLLPPPLQPAENMRNTDATTTRITEIAFLFIGASFKIE
jgi:hypothetical protein